MAQENQAISLRAKVFFAVLTVFVASAVIAIGQHQLVAPKVPLEFKDARQQGASIAESIVDLSNKLSEDLKTVNAYDKDARYSEALTLTDQLIKRSEEIRQEALKLSEELEKMAKALPEIKSATARQAALDAISSRLALISRLITYSSHLADLLNALRTRFSGSAQDQKVQVIIESINAEVTAINNFNREATFAMERFDAVTKSGE